MLLFSTLFVSIIHVYYHDNGYQCFTLEVPSKTEAGDSNFFYLSEKRRYDISCESSARQGGVRGIR